MTLRDDFYRRFGPLQAECITDFLLDNVNELKRNQGIPEITKDEYLTLLSNHITELEPYDWMGGT